MRSAILILTITLVLLPSSLWAWEYVYDGSIIPNDPALGIMRWVAQGNASMCSSDGDILRLNDTRTDALESFYKYAGSGPFTVESRVRVSGENNICGLIGISTNYSTQVSLYSDHLAVGFDYGDSPVTYLADLTTFHTLRIAVNDQAHVYVWLDQSLVAQGYSYVTGQGLVYFGGACGSLNAASGLGQSYWDYVAYSQSFNPVPEPSSLLALFTGLAGIGGIAWRRRR